MMQEMQNRHNDLGPSTASGPTRFTLISSTLGESGGGQSRFTTNLARGLTSAGVTVTICAASSSDGTMRQMESEGIDVQTLGLNTGSSTMKAKLLSPWNPIPRKLAKLALRVPEADWYVVTSDDATGVVDYLTGRSTAYISQGDLNLLYFGDSFYRTEPTIKTLLSTTASINIRRNAACAKRYTARLANSRFTRSLFSFLYGVEFDGVVYPPVDVSRFRPTNSGAKAPYVLSVARNQNEPHFALLCSIARKVPMKIVGGARVPGAESLGYVSETELVRLYAEAAFLAHPSVSEYFGYPVLESMACGTPAIAFDWGGPREVISNGVNGWTAESRVEFDSMVRDLFAQGYDPAIRSRARETTHSFSPLASARTLLSALQRRMSPSVRPRDTTMTQVSP
jgi:glycosyltransferase involved in cell wall biosynthesis